MSLQELNIRLKDYFIDLGFQYVELPLVHDSDIFYETSGEEIRSQMYSFIDGSGKEKCLRPDMTIPTCQSFIHFQVLFCGNFTIQTSHHHQRKRMIRGTRAMTIIADNATSNSRRRWP